MKKASSRSRVSPSARLLMEPLRVCLGWSEAIGEAARRLREHQASAAPVIRRGHPVGLLTGTRIEGALRLGLGEEPVARLIGVEAPRVPASTGLVNLRRKSRGTAAGLIVASTEGPIQGFVTKRRIVESEALSQGGSRDLPAASSLRRRLARALTREQLSVLRSAGELAASRGLRLHLVGGLVRDLFLGSEAPDLDLAVEKDGPAFARRLATRLGGQATIHPSFGTAVVMLPGQRRVDVATMRREIYDSPAALPRVESGTFLDDLLRRDITINAMAVRLDGEHHGTLVDEMGGMRDLRSGTLRVHHLASVCEDPTRAFRIARFSARLGFEPSAETLASIRLARDTGAFDALGGERLHHEFRLVAKEPDPLSAVTSFARMDLLRHLDRSLRFDRDARRTLGRLITALRRGPLADVRGMPDLSFLILMVLTMDTPAASRRSLARRLKITGEMRDRLIESRGAVSRLWGSLRRTSTPVGIVRVCDRFPPEALAIGWAASDPDSRRTLDLYLRRLRSIRPLLTGRDLESMGLPPGPLYRVILARLREARIAGRLRGRRSEKAMAERLTRQLGRKGH